MFFDSIFAIFRAFVAHKMQLQYYNDFPKYATLIQKFFKKFSTKNRILFIFRHIIFQNTQKVVRNEKPTSFIKYNKAKHHIIYTDFHITSVFIFCSCVIIAL